MFCGKCGHKFSSTNMAFCTQCGTKVPSAEPIGTSAEQLVKPRVMNKKALIAVIAASIAIVSVLIVVLLFFGDSNEEDVSVPSVEQNGDMVSVPDVEYNEVENDELETESHIAVVRVQGVELVVQPRYNRVQPIFENLFAVFVGDHETGLWGFIDANENEIIPPRYDLISFPSSEEFCVGLVPVFVGDRWAEFGLWGLIDADGNQVVPPKYHRISPLFIDDLAAVTVFSDWFVEAIHNNGGHDLWEPGAIMNGFIDVNGNEVIPLVHDGAGFYINGLAAVGVVDWESETALWGFIDRAGNEIVPPTYENIDVIFNGYDWMIAVQVGSLWGLIDTDGNELVPPQYDHLIWSSYNNLLIVRAGDWETGLWGLIDFDGNVIVPPRYNGMRNFSEGLAAVMIGDDETGLWGFIDTAGNEIVTPRYTNVESFSEGMAAVNVGGWSPGLWGFIDSTGNEVVTPRYDFTCPWGRHFSDGLAIVMSDGLYGFVDINGNEIVPPRYDRATPFYEGMAAVRVGDWETSLWGFINTSGNYIIPPRFNELNPAGQRELFSEGLTAVREDSMWFFVNSAGEMFPIDLDIEISFIGIVHNGLAAIRAGDEETGLWGVIRVITDASLLVDDPAVSSLPDRDNLTVTQDAMFADDSHYYEISMSMDWSFPTSRTPSENALVRNLETNSHTVFFELYLEDIGEVIFVSPFIPLGATFSDFVLDADLVAGEYTALMTFFLVDDEHEIVTTVSINRTFTILA